jgi:hypothetical protein
MDRRPVMPRSALALVVLVLSLTSTATGRIIVIEDWASQPLG